MQASLAGTLAVPLDTHSEATVVGDMLRVDKRLHLLRNLIDGALEFTTMLRDTVSDLDDGLALCKAAPSFREEPAVEYVLKNTAKLVKYVSSIGTNSEKFSSEENATHGVAEAKKYVLEARQLMDEFPSKVSPSSKWCCCECETLTQLRCPETCLIVGTRSESSVRKTFRQFAEVRARASRVGREAHQQRPKRQRCSPSHSCDTNPSGRMQHEMRSS